ncbi:MAG: cation-translocating P-type ATPase [Rhodothermales bacterium]
MNRCAHCDLPVPGGGVPGGDAAPKAVYCCYGCRMVAEVLGSGVGEGRSPEEQALLYRLFVGTLLAGFTMVLSVAISSGYGFGTLRALESDWDAAHWAMLLAAIPALVLLGPPVLHGALRDLRRGRLTLEVLFALGTTSAVAASAVSFVRGTGPVYLETAAMLLALYTLGRYLDARTRGETTRVLRRLLDVPTVAYERLRPDPGSVLPDELRVGDLVRIRAGDVLPADGAVARGRGFVDESKLTGESAPAAKAPGASVYAGTASLDGSLVVRVTATGTERRLARVERLMREALTRPPRIVQTTDRILRWLIPGVVALALATFAGWFWVAGFERALYASLSVVLIACPCALGLAIPLVLHVALGAAARRGLLVRSGQALLDLGDVRAVVLDKTGTLTGTTSGRVRVIVPPPSALVSVASTPAFVGGDGRATGWPVVAGLSPEWLSPESEADGDRLLALAAAVEGGVQHPLAEAVYAEARVRRLVLPEVVEAHVLPGIGVRGLVWSGGILREVAVGNVGVLNGERGDDLFLDAAQFIEAEGSRALFLAVDAHPVAVLAVAEHPVEHAEAAVRALRAEGLHVEMLSGDRGAATRALARRLGVPSRGDASPEAKLTRVEALRAAHGPVAAVGDGINDAAALAAADVGIALARGAALAVEAADVALYDPDLRGLPWLVRLARQTRQTIRHNLVWTFAYNAVGLGLAVAGLLHPLVAVVVMVLSSAFVTWNALRLRARLSDLAPGGDARTGTGTNPS